MTHTCPPHASVASALAALAGVASIAAMALLPAMASAAPTRVLVTPTHTQGEVRAVHHKRVEKAVRDTLSFSGNVAVVADTAPVVDKRDRAPAVVADDPRIHKGDLLRQEGSELAAAGNHKEALHAFATAIKMYEQAYRDLVDYTKLADAYARAGVSAFAAGKGAKVAARYFDDGLTLQPTLAIDRRKADKALVELFDARRAAAEAATKGAIRVEGDTPGAIVFVDGVKVGPLPAEQQGLVPGTHVVQVRSDDHETFAARVRLGRKDVVVKARLKPLAKADASDDGPAEITFAALEDCGAKGEMTSRACVSKVKRVAKQTASDFVLYSLLVADRYGRLTLYAFLQRADGKVVGVPEREIDKDLTDVSAKLAELARDVGALVADFPAERALERKPKVFR